MARPPILALAVIAAVAAATASAQTLDRASADALSATLRVLNDPAARAGAIAGDPRAGAADRRLQSLAGSPALTQELYALAAEVFEDAVRGAGGDVTKIADALQRGQADPASFAALLSPGTLAKLRALSVKMSDQRR